MDGSVLLGNRFFRESLSEILQNRSEKKAQPTWQDQVNDLFPSFLNWKIRANTNYCK